MTAAREAILLMTHFIDPMIVAHARRLAVESGGRDVFVLLNRSDDINPTFRPPADVRVFGFTVDDLRALDYPIKGRRIRDKDIELFSFTFWKAHPQYDRLWVVEYDVVFTGLWSELFDYFSGSDAALLATSIHRWSVNPEWPNWSSVAPPHGSPADLPRFIRAFMPLYRMSSAAYAVLDQAYRTGWEGFYEGIVPRILLDAGLAIEDIGGDGEFVRPENRNRFYTSTPSDNTLSPGSFVFRPIMTKPGAEPDKLWHPVKPEQSSHRTGWPIKRREQIVHRARTFALHSIARLNQLFARQ